MSKPNQDTQQLQSFDNVQLLFVSGYYDQPINGLATIADVVYWFEAKFSDEEAHATEYILYELSAEQTKRLLQRKQLFEQMVGTHWSFDIPREERKRQPQENFMKYYQRPEYNEDIEFTKQIAEVAPAIGTFKTFCNNLRR